MNAETYIRNLDSRAMPRYTFGEASSYLGLPESTMRAWFAGMPVRRGGEGAKPGNGRKVPQGRVERRFAVRSILTVYVSSVPAPSGEFRGLVHETPGATHK
jgi:hypothetical protein